MNSQLNAIIRYKNRPVQKPARVCSSQLGVMMAVHRMRASNLDDPKVFKRFVVNEHIDVCLVSKTLFEIETAVEAEIHHPVGREINTRKTMIYIDGEPFRQCMYLILRDVDVYSDAETMDDVISSTPPENKIDEGAGFLSEDEAFVGHCSNVQAWAENGYDPAIMDTRLSIPILSQLSRAGDAKAKRVLEWYFDEKLLGENENVAVAFFESKKYVIMLVDGLVKRFENHAFLKGWNLALEVIKTEKTLMERPFAFLYLDPPRATTLDQADFDFALWE